MRSNSTLYVTEGRDLIGVISGGPGGFDAFTADGAHLGHFEKRKDALGAVNAAAPPVCAADARCDGSE